MSNRGVSEYPRAQSPANPRQRRLKLFSWDESPGESDWFRATSRFPHRPDSARLQCALPTVSRLLAASAEAASSSPISRSSLLSVLLRQTAQATPTMQSMPTR